MAAAEVLRETASPREAVEDLLERASEGVRWTDSILMEPHVLEGRARLATREGEPAATEMLRQAQARYAELGATGHAERLARELGL